MASRPGERIQGKRRESLLTECWSVATAVSMPRRRIITKLSSRSRCTACRVGRGTATRPCVPPQRRDARGEPWRPPDLCARARCRGVIASREKQRHQFVQYVRAGDEPLMGLSHEIEDLLVVRRAENSRSYQPDVSTKSGFSFTRGSAPSRLTVEDRIVILAGEVTLGDQAGQFPHMRCVGGSAIHTFSHQATHDRREADPLAVAWVFRKQYSASSRVICVLVMRAIVDHFRIGR